MACSSLTFPAVLSALISRMCVAGGNTDFFWFRRDYKTV